ncbi:MULTISPECIES: hypothetical protein [unclassified Methylobacterium]|uniref:hypothetical protein n=1 Tax=unclassified Methylobacterium TaxID=2615210 RepID=UPI0008EF0482|nr:MULTISPECIES: hypothetical protein [unclassified Methylobacterium]SFU68011.1 hypothetical protein SAMN02799643_01775 [Methylobacterium sp. UNCCL125]
MGENDARGHGQVGQAAQAAIARPPLQSCSDVSPDEAAHGRPERKRSSANACVAKL